MDSSHTDTRLVVVSGAASGIGRATAELLVERGHRVIGVDLAAPPDGFGEALHWIQGDVTAAATWTRVEVACRALDPLGAQGFVACAGTADGAPFADTPLDTWRRLFEINVLGVVQGMQTLIPPMRVRGAGAIAVVSSISAFIVEDASSAYCASKAALLQAVRSAALEYAGDGLRINAVCPGIVDTPLLRGFVDVLDDPGAVYGAWERRTPTGKLLRAEEVAEVLCFLVGDGASGLSGASVTIDGGLTTTFDFDVTTRTAVH